MPRFKITAPDGRTVVITGDKTPTGEDLDQIFAALPPKAQATETPKETTLLDKVGQTFNDANPLLEQTARGIPIVGGLYNSWTAATDATADYLADKLNGKTSQNADGTPMTWLDRYNAHKGQIDAEEKALEEARPWQSMGAALVGGAALPIGVATKGATLTNKVAEAAKVGIPLGALDMGIRKEGNLEDRIRASAQGGALGALFAPVAGVGSWAIGKVADRILTKGLQNALGNPKLNLSKKQFKILSEEVGGDDVLQRLIKTAQDKGVSLAELGDPNIARALSKANMVSPTARRTIANARDEYQNNLGDKNNQIFTETLGEKVGVQDLDALKSEATKGAAELYNAAWKNKLSGQDVMELNNNTLIRDAVNDVNRNLGLTFGGRKEIDPQSVEYWDGVKRSLDDRISRFYKDGVASDPQKVSHLVEARTELVNKLDKVAPTYKAARDIYSSGYEIDNAYDLGKKVLWNNETSTVLSKANELGNSTAAKNAMKMGVRDAIEEKIGGARGDNTFKDVLTPNTQKKIKALVGEKEGQALIDYAETNFNLKQTFNKATQGSPTAEREQFVTEAIGPLTNLAQGKPVSAASQVVGKTLQKGAKAIGKATDDTNYNKVATAILTPVTKNQQQIKNTATNRILNALGRGMLITAPTVQTFPARAAGVTNMEVLKALGY